MGSFERLSQDPVEIINERQTTYHSNPECIIQAQSIATSGICPACHFPSLHGHGWYQRQLQDLPCIGENTRLQLTVRRFRCANPACPQKTFVEQFPDWLPRYTRRTERLTHLMREIGFEVSAENTRWIFSHMCVVASGDTVLRVVKRTIIVSGTSPRVVGLDDWAIRKGHR